MPALDISTIIFAIIAIFVVWKLRSVLGTRTGEEQPPVDANPRRDAPSSGVNRVAAKMGQVIRLPGAGHDAPPTSAPPADPQRWKGFAEPGSKVWAGLDAIAAADSSFSPAGFVGGAKAAYEMIVGAFAAGDRNALANLLAPDVLDNFSKAIAQRAAAGETMQTTLVSIDSAVIEDARLAGGVAQIAVRFAAKLISFTRDKAGAVVEGSADAVADHFDIWTFSREAASRNPNWLLAATETAH